MNKRRKKSKITIFWIIVVLAVIGVLSKHSNTLLTLFPEGITNQSYESVLGENSTTHDFNETEKITPIEVLPTESSKIVETEVKKTIIPSSEISESTERETDLHQEIFSELTEQSSEIEASTIEGTTSKTTIEYDTIESKTEYVGTIYLTFDDGPSVENTTQILDILSKYDIKATFFILDYKYDSEIEQLVIREFNEGHTIALHGTSHNYSKIYSSLESLIKNFETLQEKVYNSTGFTSNIIRFPGGSSNTVSQKYCVGIMSQAVEYFSTTDFVYFDWNVDSMDAGGAKSAEDVYQNVTSNLVKGRDNVILMHDSSDKIYTVQALESIIQFSQNEGYEFKAITSQTPQVVHKVAN